MTIDPGHLLLMLAFWIASVIASWWIGFDAGENDERRRNAK